MTTDASARKPTRRRSRQMARKASQRCVTVSSSPTNTSDQTMRWASASSEPAGSSSGQYSGNSPQHRYAPAPMARPLRESFTSGTYARRPLGIPGHRVDARSWQDPGDEWQCCSMSSASLAGSPTPRRATPRGTSSASARRPRTVTTITGEARLIDAIVPPRSRILDAGCGPGSARGRAARPRAHGRRRRRRSGADRGRRGGPPRPDVGGGRPRRAGSGRGTVRRRASSPAT